MGRDRGGNYLVGGLLSLLLERGRNYSLGRDRGGNYLVGGLLSLLERGRNYSLGRDRRGNYLVGGSSRLDYYYYCWRGLHNRLVSGRYCWRGGLLKLILGVGRGWIVIHTCCPGRTFSEGGWCRVRTVGAGGCWVETGPVC